MVNYHANGKMNMDSVIEKSRNQLQRTAMFALYDLLTYMDMQEDVDVEMIVSGVSGLDYKDAPVYVKEIMIGTIRHYADMVKALESRMNKWTFARLNRVEQAILLLSLTHYFYTSDKVDRKVVINVAVELAKSYLDAKDYKFVNAILDKILINPEEGPVAVKAEEIKETVQEPSETKKEEETTPVLGAKEENKPAAETEKLVEPIVAPAEEECKPEEKKETPKEEIVPAKIEQSKPAVTEIKLEEAKEGEEPLKIETPIVDETKNEKTPAKKKAVTKKKAAPKKATRKPRAKKEADEHESK